MNAAGAGAVRGASAYVDAARIVRQLVPLRPEEGSKFGVPKEEAWRYVSIANGKANLAPIDGRAWIELKGVKLGNRTIEYPDGDEVQTVARWLPPVAKPVTPSEMHLVQQAISANPGRTRAHRGSNDWVGYLVAGVFCLDIGHGARETALSSQQAIARRRVSDLIAEGLKSGQLVEAEGVDPDTRKKHPYIRIGAPAMLQPEAEESHLAADTAILDVIE